MQVENLSHVSTGKPTYWLSDRRKLPDLIDFRVVKRIPVNSLHVESSCDLSSDFSPVILTIHSRIIPQTSPPTLSTKTTNWGTFRNHIKENLTLDIPLTANRDIEDYLDQFVQIIQQAAQSSTFNPHKSPNMDKCALTIKQKILDKRKLRKRWQNSRLPHDKAKLNKAVNELKQLLNDHKQKAIQTYLESRRSHGILAMESH